MIRGMHAMFYSSDAGALRAFLRDKLGLAGTDVRYCDDIQATVRALSGRGVEFTGPPEDHGYGLVTFFKVPGGLEVQLHRPHYRE